MDYIGISSGFHDAALSVINSKGDITFAAHSERYNKSKHTKHLGIGIVEDALNYVEDRHSIELHYSQE